MGGMNLRSLLPLSLLVGLLLAGCVEPIPVEPLTVMLRQITTP